MDAKQFAGFRKKLKKTQKQMAQLLGTSIKAIHSYEQGWRSIPAHAERQMLFLLSKKMRNNEEGRMCWDVKDCPDERRENCPSWEFKSGEMCWFINGTICSGSVHQNWKDKMKICKTCKVYASLMESINNE